MSMELPLCTELPLYTIWPVRSGRLDESVAPTLVNTFAHSLFVLRTDDTDNFLMSRHQFFHALEIVVGAEVKTTDMPKIEMELLGTLVDLKRSRIWDEPER